MYSPKRYTPKGTDDIQGSTRQWNLSSEVGSYTSTKKIREVKKGMIVLQHGDFFGSAEELKEWDEAFKKAADKTEGIEYMGRYTPHMKKYHWTRFWKCDSYGKFLEVLGKTELTRDYSKSTHGEMEIYTET